MDDHDNTCLWLASFLIVGTLPAIGIAAIFYNIGFNCGVRAHADGTHVVVELPDGTRPVCQVVKKEPANASR